MILERGTIGKHAEGGERFVAGRGVEGHQHLVGVPILFVLSGEYVGLFLVTRVPAVAHGQVRLAEAAQFGPVFKRSFSHRIFLQSLPVHERTQVGVSYRPFYHQRPGRFVAVIHLGPTLGEQQFGTRLQRLFPVPVKRAAVVVRSKVVEYVEAVQRAAVQHRVVLGKEGVVGFFWRRP